MTGPIITSREGAINVMRFNRPDKKNAITRAMYQALTEAIMQAEADDSMRAHVIFGTRGIFSSGNDIQDFLAVAMGGSMGTEVIDFLRALAVARKPMLSGVDGLAVGVGVTIHMHCDLTFATPGSRFHTPFVDLALVPEAGSSLLAPLAMGHQQAYALLAAGVPFSAQEAASAGLIYKVVDEDQLEPQVMAMADALARKPPTALAHAKRLMKPSSEAVIARQMEEAKLFAEQLKSEEARLAFQAFMSRGK